MYTLHFIKKRSIFSVIEDGSKRIVLFQLKGVHNTKSQTQLPLLTNHLICKYLCYKTIYGEYELLINKSVCSFTKYLLYNSEIHI